jgi:tripartite-type tricarboxylate transporter receptor subunit TctC
MKQMSDSPKWKERYLKHYMLSPAWTGSQEFMQFVMQNEELFKGILKELGLVK